MLHLRKTFQKRQTKSKSHFYQNNIRNLAKSKAFKIEFLRVERGLTNKKMKLKL